MRCSKPVKCHFLPRRWSIMLKYYKPRKCKRTTQSITLFQQTFGSFTSAEVNTACEANSTSVLCEKRRAWKCSVCSNPLSHPIFPAHFCHYGVGTVLAQISFFTDSPYRCPRKCCPLTGTRSLEEVTKLQWELKALLSPLQSFWGQIQNTKVSASIKIHLEQSFWVSIFWKVSNIYMQSVP